MTNWQKVIDMRDVLFLTLDALRFDVAARALDAGQTPTLAALLPRSGWQARHTPGTFTLPAHQAFFSGFWPTPAAPGRHERPMALRFQGSRTTGRNTLVFDTRSIVAGFAEAGYRTCCIGGTAFFDPRTPLGQLLPSCFLEAHWLPRFGVGNRKSAEQQFRFAARWLGSLRMDERALLFINVSATHRPTHFYLSETRVESPASQAAALADVDRSLPILLDAFRARGGCAAIVCADHGTCFGEVGYTGHGIAHPAVLTVPFAEVQVQP